MNSNANNNRNNNNNVDDIVVVHKIPKWPQVGMAPGVQLDIMAGQYTRTTRYELLVSRSDWLVFFLAFSIVTTY
jgi:hypothetical protein